MPCPPTSTNSGNSIVNNFGTANQHIYHALPSRPPSPFWLDRMCRGLAMWLTVALVACVWHWMYEQWQPFLTHPIPAGGVLAQYCATFPLCFTATALAVGYGYCNVKIFSLGWGPFKGSWPSANPSAEQE